MYDQERFIRTMSDFARQLLTPHDIEGALTDLAGHAADVLGLAGSGVSLGRGDDLIFATAVPEHLKELEQVQEEHGKGPCITAYREERVVAVDDLTEHAGQWPEYCDVAKATGVSSVASLPMQLHGIRVGCLNLYADGPRSWDDEDLSVGVVMADVATGYLINASVVHEQAELNSQLQKALDSRIIIEQAKGVVANSQRISVDAAFQQMRDYARANHLTVKAVAIAVVRHDVTL
jgi:GAF domain-containing protein